MKRTQTFEGFVNKSNSLNEAVVKDLSLSANELTVSWVLNNEKEKYQTRVKICNNAENGMKVLADIMNEVEPGKWYTDNMAFTFETGTNQGYVLVQRDESQGFGNDLADLKRHKDFQKYFQDIPGQAHTDFMDFNRFRDFRLDNVKLGQFDRKSVCHFPVKA